MTKFDRATHAYFGRRLAFQERARDSTTARPVRSLNSESTVDGGGWYNSKVIKACFPLEKDEHEELV